MRLAVATRSMNDFLYRASGELLGLEGSGGLRCSRHRFTGTDNLGYFRELLRLDADWVISLDEDAFVLDPARLLGLVRIMDEGGYAACGMPDGGVVGIRRHNPAACNAYFNIFDLRRVREVWNDWGRVLSATHRPEYEARVAAFAGRTPFAFDHFERYYGVFFSLLGAGERFLYLDAEDWPDGVSTLLKNADGAPLLVHCWYSRYWDSSYHTRQRYRAVIEYARQVQGLEPYSWAPDGQPARLPVPAESRFEQCAPTDPSAADPEPWGDPLTYVKAARFLGGLAAVEDWGCGGAWFRNFLPDTIRYKGIDADGSAEPDEIADLARYTSHVDGILLRHVLEHNPAWEAILANALRSFTRRLVLVLSTPFADATRVLGQCIAPGIPDLAFAKADLVRHFGALPWSAEENVPAGGCYGVEHIFYLEQPPGA
jgi:hypothetical protein